LQHKQRRDDVAAQCVPWSTATEGFRLPPRQIPQDQYAEGILSLFEKATGSLFLFCGEIPMKAGGRKAEPVIHNRHARPTARR
jgi:hypothetical protein